MEILNKNQKTVLGLIVFVFSGMISMCLTLPIDTITLFRFRLCGKVTDKLDGFCDKIWRWIDKETTTKETR